MIGSTRLFSTCWDCRGHVLGMTVRTRRAFVVWERGPPERRDSRCRAKAQLAAKKLTEGSLKRTMWFVLEGPHAFVTASLLVNARF